MSDEFGFDDVDAYHNERTEQMEKRAGRKSRYQDSDEDSEVEVMGLSEEEEDDDDDEEQTRFGFEKDIDSDEAEFFNNGEDGEAQGAAGSDDENWGVSRENYYGGDEVDENDPEVAKQMEEEALRQQKRHLQELNMDDYMDEDMAEEWQKSKDTQADQRSVLVAEVPRQDLSELDSAARLDLLKSSYPEFIPLSKELNKLKPVLDNLRKQKDDNELLGAKFTSLSAYMGAISSYFALFLSGFQSGESAFTMKDHPVMEVILMTRECWRQASELPDDVVDTVDQEEALSESEPDVRSMKTSVSSDESDYESEDETAEQAADDNDDLNMDFTAKREIKRLAKKRDDELDDVDADDKRSRRKTLRFYTSKIDQAENKKDSKYGGDEDLPYKERLYERQQRLLEEARKRGLKESGPGVDLDDNDMNSDEEAYAREINGGADNDYYNSLKDSKRAAKDKRKQVHAEVVRAAKEGKLAELQETIGDDGKRGLNYQIMKNKGLTPHRNKDNRNSRVKKRKKYEKAQKKLKSVRAVYSENQGPYSGEKTGIKKGLTKSVRLA